VATVVVGHGPMAIQPVVTAFTVCATIWALFLTVPAGRPRLGPGERIMGADEYVQLTAGITAGLARAHDLADREAERDRHLRAVSGDC
jgi:hypothetical protein